jgi:PAS domain S-box-containing protein
MMFGVATGWSQMAAVNLIGSYNYALVALSVLIAMFASYAALDLAGRVTAAGGWTRAIWLLGGAGAMGTGIWSMHYIGMLAFILPIPVAYHWPTVLLSLFAAILASVIALYVVSRQKMGASRAVAGSILMGAGIASMHYIGMAAMRLPAICQFNSFLVVLSVVFAVLISLAALWITFHFRDEKNGIGWEKLAGAVVMGAAIPVMHYIGMAAASFTPSGMPADLSHAVSISTLGTAGIAAVTFIVLGLALLTSSVDRRFAAQTLELQEEKLERSEAYLAEAQRLSRTGSFGWRVSTGEIIWSEETFRIFQYDRTTTPTVELILQRVHPEDVVLVKQTIERASQDGKNFEHEYRLLMPDGSVKYVRVVAHTLSDEPDSVEFIGAVTDITERKRAEEALQRSESNLAEAQRLTHTGSWAWRVAGREALHLSEEWYRVYGFDPEHGMPAWEERLQRVHPEDRAKWQGAIDRAIAEKSKYEVEFRILLPDGTVKYIHTVGHPVLTASGDLTEFVGSAADVTERRRAEEALRRSEGYLAQAQRLTQSGSWAWNVRTGARFWSQETFRIFGYGPEKVKPTWSDILDRVHPEDRPAIVQQAKMETTLKEDSEFDWRIVLPDGRIKHLHSIARPVMDASGEITEIVGTLIDVTERKRAEALRDGESRILEMIARDAPLDEILEKLVLVVEAQFAGLLCSVLLLEEDGQHARHGAAPSLPQPYSRAIDGLCIGPKAGSCGTAMYRRETVVVTDILQDPLWESYRDVAAPYGLRACWSTPILAHSGKALGSFAMYYREPRSPSPAETRALKMATHLAGIAIERKLARAERERLRQAPGELAHINRVTTMGELTASLAHEVNQPIAAALTDANTCMRWLTRDQPDLEEARGAASRVVKDATRAAEIIARVRLVFKKGVAERELVDVNELIREMIILLRNEMSRHSISVRTELAEALPQVMGDRVQLQQVMMNLIMNSIDAMKDVDGTRELTINSQSAESEQLMVSVSDTGVGLPSEQANQIFNAFFSTKAHGTGMGLRISRSIVESHGGRLWAADNSPRGATFHLTLPAKVETRE